MTEFRQVKDSPLLKRSLYFMDPFFFERSQERKSLILKQHKLTKISNNMLTFVHRLILENKLKQVYRKLDTLFYLAHEEMLMHQATGLVAEDLHPLKEQQWFVDEISKKITNFSSRDILHVIMNHEHREKYAKFVHQTRDLDSFELFFQNYFIPALSKRTLKNIFLLIFEERECERCNCFKKFFECLHYKQGKLILEALSDDPLKRNMLNTYCKYMATYMRNTQITWALDLFPQEMETIALSKLYPYEVLEVVEKQTDDSKRRLLIQKILKSCRGWWSSFSQEEINKTLSLLNAK